MVKRLIFFLAPLLMFCASCKKYAEGPTISLLPRTERVEGKWVIETADLNGTDSTSVYQKYIWEFTRAGSVILQIDTLKTLGIWTLATSDKDLVIELDNGNRQTYEIRELRHKKIWLRNKKNELNLKLKPY